MHTKNLQAEKMQMVFKNVRKLMENTMKMYIQFSTSSSSGNCLKCRWNFFCCPLLKILRFFSVQTPSVDLLAIDLAELEFDEKFIGGCKWSCVACWLFDAVAMTGTRSIMFVFEDAFGTAPSDWYCILDFFCVPGREKNHKINSTLLTSIQSVTKSKCWLHNGI